jgi:1-deoxy-D-xylulose-5-phosphate reductoisomerase
MTQQSIAILGATGSIGQSTIDVVKRHPDRFKVQALSGYTRMSALAQAAQQTNAACVVVPDDKAAVQFRASWSSSNKLPEIRVGSQALVDTAAEEGTDIVMAAIVGIAGLPSVLAAACAGKRVLLANKESLVASGSLLMKAVSENGATLLPIDSEHNAIFQCMPPCPDTKHAVSKAGVQRLVLTASGGPFRCHPLSALASVTPEQACAHPNWDMGRKISVDSATMLNKGLEVIEAHWLFAMAPEQIEVLIHPQSIVHSMVKYTDGSVIAQLGNPDMRTPIAHALGYPTRIEAGVDMLDLAAHGKLEFEAVDLERYPCLELAYAALRQGQAACIALNAANEVAVEAFLEGEIGYLDIAKIVERTLQWHTKTETTLVGSVQDVLEIDKAARTFAISCRQTGGSMTSLPA